MKKYIVLYGDKKIDVLNVEDRHHALYEAELKMRIEEMV